MASLSGTGLLSSRRDVFPKWRLYLVSIGFAMVLAPQYNLSALQTSIGVKNALGSNSILVYELLCIATLLVYVPVIGLIGRKYCLILGEIPSIIFTLSLLYPRYWTVTPAGILIGIGESLLMPASGAIIASLHLGTDVADCRDPQQKRESNIAVFITTLALGQAISSAAPNFILKLQDTGKLNDSLSVKKDFMDVTRCGSNDCPADYTFEQNSTIFGMLIPTQESFRIYLIVCCTVQLLGIVLHLIAIPSDRKATSESEESQGLTTINRTSDEASLKQSFLRLIRHLSTKLSMLTFPLLLQYGLIAGFIWSDLSRAYGSCILGVNNVGYLLFVSHTVSFLVCLFVSKLRTLLTNTRLQILACAVELICYSLALILKPTLDSTYMPYVVGALLGAAFGLYRAIVYFIASEYFDDIDSAYVVQAAGLALGTAIIYVGASLLCVYVTIYVLMAFSLIAAALAVLAHRNFSTLKYCGTT